MEDKTKIVLAIIVLVIIGLPLAGKLMQQGGNSAPGPDAGKTGKAAAQPAPAMPQARPVPQTPPPQPPGPPLLDANSLVGSVWSSQGATIYLNAGGQAVAEHPMMPGRQIPATWSVNGNTVSITAIGQTVSAQINGNQIVSNGAPITRIR